MSRYQKGKTNLDFTEARDSEWQWHQLGHMQVCTSLQTDNHTSTPPLSFLQAGCPSCRPTNSVKALKAQLHNYIIMQRANQTLQTQNSSALRHFSTIQMGPKCQAISEPIPKCPKDTMVQTVPPYDPNCPTL